VTPRPAALALTSQLHDSDGWGVALPVLFQRT
jgi:hypothetical protein